MWYGIGMQPLTAQAIARHASNPGTRHVTLTFKVRAP
jgi:hypothetical protein